MRHAALKIILKTAAILCGIAFIAKFAGPALLKMYVETGIGSCRKTPIFCMAPDDRIITPGLMDKDYIAELLPYRFPKMSISVPRGFKVVQEEIKRNYYKRTGRPYSDAAIYVIYEKPYFFTELYPQLKKSGVSDNYEFIRRTMYARIPDMNNLADLFFMIMKGIFTPNLGGQSTVKMTQFRMDGKRGFINYNLDGKINYFDCNIIDDKGGFFKVYIKDEGARLDINGVLAIISTANSS